jgi:hypothetical protein
MKGDFLMKTKFTELLSTYQDDTIKIKEKNVADSKNVLKLTGVTAKRHITMTKRSLSIAIAATVATMSCITVYAVESGTLSNFINYNNKYRSTPYSYSGTYNQTVDYETYLNEAINTDVIAKNIQCNNDDVSISVQGVICDINNVEIVANISAPNGKSLVDEYDNKNIANLYFKDFSVSTNNGEISTDNCNITFLPTTDVDANTIPIEIQFTLLDVKSADGEYNINIGNLTSYDYVENHKTNDYGNSKNLLDFNLSFDIDTTGSDASQKMDNVNKVISTPEGNATIESVNYSPMSLCLNFATPLKFNDIGLENVSLIESSRWGTSFSYYSGYDASNTDLNLDKLNGYFTTYFIYSDGTKVLANRNTCTAIFNENKEVTNIIYDYYQSQIDMVDYTNVVSIEINGTVIPLK